MKFKISMLLAALLLAALGARGLQAAGTFEDRVKRIAFTLNIAVAEYTEGVAGGKIVNPVEYGEAQEFTEQAQNQLKRVIKDKNLSEFETGNLLKDLVRLHKMIQDKTEARSVRGLVEKINIDLSKAFGVNVRPLPGKNPSLKEGQKIYAARCAICHGSSGDGKGPASAGIDPKPANFAENNLRGLTPSELWQVTTVGVDGTAMISWSDTLTEQERWDVVSYLWKLTAAPAQMEQGKKIASLIKNPPAQFQDKNFWAQNSDEEAAKILSKANESLSPQQALAAIRHMRLNFSGEPQTLLAAESNGAAGERQTRIAAQVQEDLSRSLDLYRQGDKEDAAETVLEAYLHYEGIEGRLKISRPEINQRLEPAFASLRTLMRSAAPPKQIEELAARMRQDLNRLGNGSETPPPWTLFLQSLMVILREGMEAILILAAIAAYLRRSGHASKVRHVFSGAAGAILASFATAWALEKMFKTSKLQQEALEGLTMLTAVAVLFYVSNWMISKIEIKRWQDFIQGKVKSALSSRNILALIAAAFLAVYREGFETVLFYKALHGIGAGTGIAPIWAGFALGCLILAAIFLALEYFGYRIPLKEFFMATSAFLIFMTFSFMGKGIAELQEAAWLPATPIAWMPEVPLLGIYPTLETSAGQFLILLGLGASIVYLVYIQPSRERKRLLAQTHHLQKSIAVLHDLGEDIIQRIGAHQKSLAKSGPSLKEALKELEEMDKRAHELMQKTQKIEHELLDYFEELGAKTWPASRHGFKQDLKTGS